jgi:Leucine-rich repeat (LRR) protein
MFVSNKLVIIDFGFFKGLDNLYSINFQNNAIGKIFNRENKTILHNLQELNLQFNRIESIENFAFSTMSNLNKLLLIFNNINKLKPYSLDGLNNLKELNLIGNNVTLNEPDENIFKGLENLNILALSFNSISSIKGGRFISLTSLVELLLMNNTIKHLSAYMFNGLSNLRSLNMRYNFISKIDTNAFYGLNSIKNIQFNTFNLTIRDYCNAIESLQTLLERRESRQVLGIPYYDSISLIYLNELNCELSFFFLIKNIHLNTFEDEGFFYFYNSCLLIPF